MEVVRKIGLIAFIFLAIAGLTVDLGYGLFLLLDHTKTTDTYYVNDQTPTDLKDRDDLSDEEIKEMEDRRLFEVNLYSNVDTNNGIKSGVILEELKINHFTDQTMKTDTVISSGMQYVSDYNNVKGLYTSEGAYAVLREKSTAEKVGSFLTGYGMVDVLGKALSSTKKSTSQLEFESKRLADEYVSPNFNYYESVNKGVTWDAKGLQTQLNRKTELIIKIGSGEDAEAYKLRLDKYKDNTWDNSHGNWKNPGNYWPWNWGNLTGNRGGKIDYYNWDMVFEDIMSGVLTNNMQTGIHYGVVNLSNYFTVTQHFNKKDEKWEPASEADQQITYAVVKFDYHTKGAVSNEQSIFGIIAKNSRFSLYEKEYDTDYGQHEVIYNITTASLDLRYSKAFDGYFLSLPNDLKRRLQAMPPYRMNITIDLNQKIDSKIIVGLDTNAFDGFKINKLTLLKNYAMDEDYQDFYLLDNSLRNTDLQTFDNRWVNIVNVNSGVVL